MPTTSDNVFASFNGSKRNYHNERRVTSMCKIKKTMEETNDPSGARRGSTASGFHTNKHG